MKQNKIHLYFSLILILLFIICSFPVSIIRESFDNAFNKESFDVYLINLDRNKNRLHQFLKQYQESDLNGKKFFRIQATDGKTINISKYLTDTAFKEIKNIENTGHRTMHYQLTRGAIGCYLSHLNTYKHIMDGNTNYGLIFEDDVNIPKEFYSQMLNALKKIPNSWDMLLLGCYCIKCEDKNVVNHVTKFILLHCYIVKKHAAKKLYDYLVQKPIRQQIDSEISDLIANENFLRVYCLKNPICIQGGDFKTEIQVPVKQTKGVNPFNSVS